MSDKAEPNRRHFLFSVSGATVAAAGGTIVLPACGTGGMGDGGMETGGGPVSTGLTVADVAMGAVVAATNRASLVMIGRDATGFYALSQVCTHQACTVAPTSATRLDCPCHMSHYDGVGVVVTAAPGAVNQGPLPMFPITFTGTGATAAITVNRSTPLTDRAMRFPAP